MQQLSCKKITSIGGFADLIFDFQFHPSVLTLDLGASNTMVQRSGIVALLVGLSAALQWPYERYRGTTGRNGVLVPETSRPEFEGEEPGNGFGQFLHHIVDRKNIGGLQDLFVNGSVPAHAGFDELLAALKLPDAPTGHGTRPRQRPHNEAKSVLGHLPFELDPRCTADKSKW